MFFHADNPNTQKHHAQKKHHNIETFQWMYKVTICNYSAHICPAY